ncbi:DUF3576 domain-containing protein [Roseospira visakhapatnamensis]|uniref:DUF3576 domain-containing protein n=1 Tax=Roseospira visakhapatnamensis TaxID=390880 RepID=A0A7W6RDF7_9PROT|nr:DUF3576 domain-containing protein [Roseospira visakhapatnamensis]MBB4265979.1 hypothetical protein [Roseospira visakhapatnamensis]
MRLLWVSMAMVLLAGGCEYAKPIYPDKPPGESRTVRRDLSKPYERDTIFGPGGMDLFGSGEDDGPAGTAGIGVNSFLWRASLDTIAFMPLSSADPFGGVIITDWYTPSDTPAERFKVNVYILAKALRADGIEVSVFKQQRVEGMPDWTDIPVDEGIATKLEDAILTRARQLRMASLREQ